MKKNKLFAVIPEENLVKPLGINDLYPIGDLAGCKVYEAIQHNPGKVRTHFENDRIKLDGDAIHYLVKVEFDYKAKIRRN